MGVGLAGAVANRVLNEGYKLLAFRFPAVMLVAAVLLICVGPYLVFIRPLMVMRRRGMASYGAFAREVGEQFEKKWLPTGHQNEKVLLVPDFTTTANLFSVVRTINDIRVIPVGAVDIYAIVIVALIPGIPLVVAAHSLSDTRENCREVFVLIDSSATVDGLIVHSSLRDVGSPSQNLGERGDEIGCQVRLDDIATRAR